MGTAVAALALSALLAVTSDVPPAPPPVAPGNEALEAIPAPPPGPPSDPQLAANVRSRLDRDPYVATCPIRVTVQGGVVTLTGPVGSAFLRTWAEDTVRGVLGVVAVRNQLVLDRVLPHKLDWQVEESLRWRLNASPGVQADRVGIRVVDGVVFLTGTVRTEEEQRIVVRAARRVAPQLVVDHLAVRDLAPVVRGVPLPAGLPLGPRGLPPTPEGRMPNQ